MISTCVFSSRSKIISFPPGNSTTNFSRPSNGRNNRDGHIAFDIGDLVVADIKVELVECGEQIAVELSHLSNLNRPGQACGAYAHLSDGR